MNKKTRRCFRCTTTKTLEEFALDKNRAEGRDYHCKTCKSFYEKEHSKVYASRRRDRYLKRTYNLSLEKYSQMEKVQTGLCQICRKKDPQGDKLSVDHNHKTNAVRGLLCKPCNTMIGGAQDDPNILKEAVKYLSKYER